MMTTPNEKKNTLKENGRVKVTEAYETHWCGNQNLVY